MVSLESGARAGQHARLDLGLDLHDALLRCESRAKRARLKSDARASLARVDLGLDLHGTLLGCESFG